MDDVFEENRQQVEKDEKNVQNGQFVQMMCTGRILQNLQTTFRGRSKGRSHNRARRGAKKKKKW